MYDTSREGSIDTEDILAGISRATTVVHEALYAMEQILKPGMTTANEASQPNMNTQLLSQMEDRKYWMFKSIMDW